MEQHNLGMFVKEEVGPPGVFGVFEDDGETGYLYVYEPGGREVFRHLHIYDCSSKVPVKENDVRVVWSEDATRCGALIWGKLRGVMDLASGQEGRVWLEDRETPGIGDAQWLEGFRL